VIFTDFLHPYESAGDGYLLHIVIGWKLVLLFEPKSKQQLTEL